MLASWTTVRQEGRAELLERKSQFLAFCAPLASAAAAEAYLQNLRRQYPDSRHQVFAWQMVYPTVQGRYSDDGEPQGTAALPVLSVLKTRQVEQAVVVVVRYFGGILLGTGGLVRAYSKAASLALAAAVPIRLDLHKSYKLTASYELYPKLAYHLEKAGFRQSKPTFAATVQWELAFAPERLSEAETICQAVSGGTTELEYCGEQYTETAII